MSRDSILRLAFLGLLAAGAASAQTASTNRPARQYDRRVEMHRTPTDVRAPAQEIEKETPITDSFENEGQPLDTIATMQSLIPYLQSQPVREPEEKKNRNWILPPSVDDKEKTDAEKAERATEKTKEKESSSGWGWLADGVFEQQKKAARKETEEIENEEDAERPGAIRGGMSALEVNSHHVPVSSGQASDPESQSAFMSMSSADAGGSQPVIRDQSRMGSAMKEEQKSVPTLQRESGADKLWGNEAMWQTDRSWDSKPSRSAADTVLPQSSALLSSIGRPKDPAPTASATPSSSLRGSSFGGEPSSTRGSLFDQGFSPPAGGSGGSSVGSPQSLFGSPVAPASPAQSPFGSSSFGSGNNSLQPQQPLLRSQPSATPQQPFANPWPK
jgi:hypothetical protein